MKSTILLINLPQTVIGQRLPSRQLSSQHLLRIQTQLADGDNSVEILDAESLGLNFFTIIRAIRRRAPEYVLFYQASTCGGSLPSSSMGFVGVLCRHVHERMPGLRFDLLVEQDVP